SGCKSCTLLAIKLLASYRLHHSRLMALGPLMIAPPGARAAHAPARARSRGSRNGPPRGPAASAVAGPCRAAGARAERASRRYVTKRIADLTARAVERRSSPAPSGQCWLHGSPRRVSQSVPAASRAVQGCAALGAHQGSRVEAERGRCAGAWSLARLGRTGRYAPRHTGCGSEHAPERLGAAVDAVAELGGAAGAEIGGRRR